MSLLYTAAEAVSSAQSVSHWNNASSAYNRPRALWLHEYTSDLGYNLGRPGYASVTTLQQTEMTTIAQQKAKVQEICREWPKGLWLPVGEMQRRSPIDKPARGPIWISRCEFSSSPETALRDVLYEICERLQAPEHIISPKEDLALESVGVEFIGPRGNADSKTPEPKISEPEKMKHLEEECEGDMTILYVHGGGL